MFFLLDKPTTPTSSPQSKDEKGDGLKSGDIAADARNQVVDMLLGLRKVLFSFAVEFIYVDKYIYWREGREICTDMHTNYISHVCVFQSDPNLDTLFKAWVKTKFKHSVFIQVIIKLQQN